MKRRSKTAREPGVRNFGLPARATSSQLKKILVATDFSECSRKAVDYAASFGRQFDAEVVILHVLEPGPPQFRIFEAMLMDSSLREEALKSLQECRPELSSTLKLTTLLRDGSPPFKAIVTVAEELKADLIVIGNHGRKPLERMIIGNTAEKVVRLAPCPVLVIRQTERDFVLEHN